MNQMNRSSALRGARAALLTLGALWLGLSAASCAPTEDVAQEELAEQEAGVCASGTTWPSGFVDVCWNTAADMASPYAAEVEAVAQESWSRAALIRFYGWNVCPSGSARNGKVVMSIGSTLSSVIGFLDGPGYPGTGAPRTVTFNSARSDFAGTVRHLFGRILGFEYETTSGTPPSTCSYRGHYSFDPASIMARVTSYGDLSTVDILGAQKVYGRKTSGQIVGLGGRCLNVQGGVTTNGANLVNWDCIGGAANELWGNAFSRGVANTSLLKAYANNSPPSPNLCANIAGGNPTSSGSNLISWPCDASAPNEQFKFEGVKWVVDGNRCVQAYLGNLRVASCNDFNTNWNFREDQTIQLASTNSCVQVGFGPVSGEYPVTMQTCLSAGSADYNKQRFFGRSLIQNVFAQSSTTITNYYLEAAYGYPSGTGALLRLKEPTTTGPLKPTQLFHLSGPIHTINSSGTFSSPYCVDVQNDDFALGTQVVSFPCTGYRNQVWQSY